MKVWDIEDFLKECEELCRNQYTYDYNNMPEGICNGHIVKPCHSFWHSIVIDGCICDMATINDRYPNGNCDYHVGNKKMTAIEYVRYMLEQ